MTPPEIIFKKNEKGEIMEPIEKISFEVEERFSSLILDKMNNRKGIYLNSGPHNDNMKFDYLLHQSPYRNQGLL